LAAISRWDRGQGRSYKFSENQRTQRNMIKPTAEFFESLIARDITVAATTGAELWRVESVKRGQTHALRDDQPFNVYLTAPAGNDRKQGIRSAQTPDGETCEFFAVPLAAGNEGVSYEVVFN
jgi:hypothetical protein